MKGSCCKTLFRVGILIFLLGCVLSAGVFAGEERWGYRQLENNEKLRKAYLSLQQGIEDKLTDIPLEKGIELNMEELTFVCTLLRADYPEYFWYTGNVSLSGVTAYPQYVHASRREQAVFEHEAEEILEGMEDALGKKAGAYEKALYLHDVLAQTITYDLAYMGDQSAYSAIVDNRAVCAGYARAYQYLLHRVGIPAWTIEGNGGDVFSPSSAWESHAWTLVWLDGKCCYTDVTWDDTDSDEDSGVRHTYFNRTLKEFQLDHLASNIFDSLLPQCTDHEELDYYTYMQSRIDGMLYVNGNTTAKQLANDVRVIKDQGTHYLWNLMYVDSVDEQGMAQVGGANQWLDSGVLKTVLRDHLNVKGSVTIHQAHSPTLYGLHLIIEIVPDGAQPLGWPTEIITYEQIPYRPEGEYAVKGNKLSAAVSYYYTDLIGGKTYSAWVAYYTADGALINVTQTELRLSKDQDGQLENILCPENFAKCKLFIVGEALENVSPHPLCEAIELVEK